MKSFVVEAKSNGRIVSWKKFKEGRFVDQSRFSLTPTTVLTDAVNDIYNICRQFDNDCKIQIIKPNGFTTAKFRIMFKGENYSIVCERVLVRGGFPFNPLAAEYGKNYNVIFNVDTQIEEFEQKIYEYFKSNYNLEKIS